MATKRITVTALKPVQYDGRSHVRGSVFTTTPVDAASLKYRGFVKLGGQLAGGTVPEHPSITRRLEPVDGFREKASEEPVKPEPPMPTSEEPVEQLPTAAMIDPDRQQDGAAPPPTTRGRRGRTYNRRDMVAEPPTE